MHGFRKTFFLQDYLNDLEKQSQGREAILNNPLLESVLESASELHMWIMRAEGMGLVIRLDRRSTT